MIDNFVLFGKEYSPYALISVVAILLTLLLTYKLTERRGLDPIRTLYALLYAMVGTILGGHILYGITVFDQVKIFFANLFSFPSFQAFVTQFSNAFGGAVFYGGLIGGSLAAALYLRTEKESFHAHADICAMAIPFFHAFGRIGCFVSGCCFGIEMEGGFVYHHSPIPEANGVPRFPVQLVEAGFNALLFGALLLCLCKGKLKGKLFYLYLLVYSTGRFLLEFLRGDAYRGFVGCLSTSQFISVFLFVFAVIAFIVTRKKKTA